MPIIFQHIMAILPNTTEDRLTTDSPPALSEADAADSDIAQGCMEVMWRTMEVRSFFQHLFFYCFCSHHKMDFTEAKRRHQLTGEGFSKVYDTFIKVADESMEDTESPKKGKLIDLD